MRISTLKSVTCIAPGRVGSEANSAEPLTFIGTVSVGCGSGREIDIVLNSDNQLETRTFIWSTWLELETNGWGGIRIYRNFENLTEDFEIREGIIIPSGTYSYNNYSLMLNAEGNVFNGRVGFNIGDFYNGTRRGFDIRLDLRLTETF